MEIRRYESRDLEQIACLFYETVHTSHLNHIESQIKSEYLSVPSKAILLEEGKVAEKRRVFSIWRVSNQLNSRL